MTRFTAVVLLTAVLFPAPSPASSVLPDGKPLVRFGINLRYPPMIMYKRYQPLMDYLSSRTPYRFELKISRNYDDLLLSLRKGETQVIAPGDGALVKALLIHNAVPIVMPLNSSGKPVYRAAVIVRSDSPITSLRQTVGKKVALGAPHSTSGNLLARGLFIRNGIRLSDLRVDNLHNHDAVAKGVLHNQYDVGVVKESIAEHYRQFGVRVIAYSEEVPAVPFLAREGVSPEIVRAVRDALVSLDCRKPEHRKLLDLWDDEIRYGFTSARREDYKGLLRLFRGRPYGCSRGCHR